MNKFVPLGLGAAAVVAALVIGAQVLGPPAPGDVGGVPSASPSLTPAPTATLQPSPSPIAAPRLTQTFNSQMHGISVSYPEGWTARAATEPWTAGMSDPHWDSAFADILYDPVLMDHLFLAIASQPVRDSTPEDWVAEVMASGGCAASEPIAVDGTTGLIGAGDCDEMVAFTTAGRGYVIHLFASDDEPAAVAGYDRAWFEEVLATVQATSSAVYPMWFTPEGDGAGILAAGSQTTRQFLGGSTFTVPTGWVNDGDYALVYTLFPDTPANEAEYALSGQTAQGILMTDKVGHNMFAFCDATGLFPSGTASEVMDAVVANQALSASVPVDVTIGNLRGHRVDLQLSPDWTGSCAVNPNDPMTKDYADARNRLILLETPAGGTLGIAIASAYASDFKAFVADAMPIVESFRFDFAP